MSALVEIPMLRHIPVRLAFLPCLWTVLKTCCQSCAQSFKLSSPCAARTSIHAHIHMHAYMHVHTCTHNLPEQMLHRYSLWRTLNPQHHRINPRVVYTRWQANHGFVPAAPLPRGAEVPTLGSRNEHQQKERSKATVIRVDKLFSIRLPRHPGKSLARVSASDL